MLTSWRHKDTASCFRHQAFRPASTTSMICPIHLSIISPRMQLMPVPIADYGHIFRRDECGHLPAQPSFTMGLIVVEYRDIYATVCLLKSSIVSVSKPKTDRSTCNGTCNVTGLGLLMVYIWIIYV